LVDGVGQIKGLVSAGGVIEEMISGAEAVIRKRLGSMVRDQFTLLARSLAGAARSIPSSYQVGRQRIDDF